MARVELNTAIRTVLLTQFKKDAPEAFKIVEAAGYEVYKYNGSFGVKNTITDRHIRIQAGRNYGRMTLLYGYSEARVNNDLLACFDFAGCLNKPMNKTWHEMQHVRAWGKASPTLERYEELKSARWSVNYDAREIAKIQEQIEKLTRDLVRAAQSKTRSEEKLQACKAKLGLK